MDFFSSPLGVAISWVVSVLSFLWGLYERSEHNKVKLKLKNYSSNDENSIQQSGEKNVNVRDVSGGMKIKM